MLITILSGPMEGSQSTLVYFSEDECLKGAAGVSDTFNGAYDHNIKCMVSNTPSGSVKPKLPMIQQQNSIMIKQNHY